MRESTADLISSLGHEALIFGSGEQFLASGCLKDTACIITDLHMPGLNGLDLQSRLLAEGHRTPIIFITAYPKDAARSRALNGRRSGVFDQAVRGERIDKLAGDRPETMGEILTPARKSAPAAGSCGSSQVRAVGLADATDPRSRLKRQQHCSRDYRPVMMVPRSNALLNQNIFAYPYR